MLSSAKIIIILGNKLLQKMQKCSLKGELANRNDGAEKGLLLNATAPFCLFYFCLTVAIEDIITTQGVP
jgi:hypothetical protein